MRSLGPHLVEGVTCIAVIQRHISLPRRPATGWRSLTAAPPVSPRRAARKHISNYYRSLVIHLSSFNYRYSIGLLYKAVVKSASGSDVIGRSICAKMSVPTQHYNNVWEMPRFEVVNAAHAVLSRTG